MKVRMNIEKELEGQEERETQIECIKLLRIARE
jgi:hypothetical protein